MYKHMFLATFITTVMASENYDTSDSSSRSDEEIYTVFTDPDSPSDQRVTNSKQNLSIPINNQSPFYIKRILPNGSIEVVHIPPTGYEKTIYNFFIPFKRENNSYPVVKEKIIPD